MAVHAPRDYSVLVLITLDNWTLADVRNVVDAVDGMYGLALTTLLAQQRVEHRRGGTAWTSPTLSEYLLSPQLREPPDSGGWSPEPSHPPVGSASADLPFGPEVRYLRYLYDHRYEIAPSARPDVFSWQMASPGHITILGLGPLMRQIRELIKDLRYRNRHEEELGKLEVARRRLELERSVLSPPVMDYVATEAIAHYQQLRALETAGKLKLTRTADEVAEIVVAELTILGEHVPEVRALLPRARRLRRLNSPQWRDNLHELELELRTLTDDNKITGPKAEELRELLGRLRHMQQPAA